MSDADLVAGNIRSGVDVFGVPGTYEVLFGDLATSSANRTYTTPAITLTTETSTHAGAGVTPDLPGTYRPVPRIDLDDDGYTSRPAADSGTDTNVVFVDRTGWSTTTCGTTQTTLADRIANCATTFNVNATWDGPVKAKNGEGGLASRGAHGRLLRHTAQCGLSGSLARRAQPALVEL